MLPRPCGDESGSRSHVNLVSVRSIVSVAVRDVIMIFRPDESPCAHLISALLGEEARRRCSSGVGAHPVSTPRQRLREGCAVTTKILVAVARPGEGNPLSNLLRFLFLGVG